MFISFCRYLSSEMQIKGRSFDFWSTLCLETSIAQVTFLLSYATPDVKPTVTWFDLPVIFWCRLSEAWHNCRPMLVDVVKSLLDEQNLGVRKALSEVFFITFLVLSSGSLQHCNSRRFLFTIGATWWQLIVVMASHCYLIGPSGELFVEYLVRHCALPDQEKHQSDSRSAYPALTYRRFEVCICFCDS